MSKLDGRCDDPHKDWVNNRGAQATRTTKPRPEPAKPEPVGARCPHKRLPNEVCIACRQAEPAGDKRWAGLGHDGMGDLKRTEPAGEPTLTLKEMTELPEPDFCVCDYRPRRACTVHPAVEEQRGDAAERAAFEKWAATHGNVLARCITKGCGREGEEHYENSFTEVAWEGWQARAALIRQEHGSGPNEEEMRRRLQVCLVDIETLLRLAGSTVTPKQLAMIKLNVHEVEELLKAAAPAPAQPRCDSCLQPLPHAATSSCPVNMGAHNSAPAQPTEKRPYMEIPAKTWDDDYPPGQKEKRIAEVRAELVRLGVPPFAAEAPAQPAQQVESCPDCGAVYSMMEPGGVTNWGCENAFHSRGRVSPAPAGAEQFNRAWDKDIDSQPMKDCVAAPAGEKLSGERFLAQRGFADSRNYSSSELGPLLEAYAQVASRGMEGQWDEMWSKRCDNASRFGYDTGYDAGKKEAEAQARHWRDRYKELEQVDAHLNLQLKEAEAERDEMRKADESAMEFLTRDCGVEDIVTLQALREEAEEKLAERDTTIARLCANTRAVTAKEGQ